jgi:hypothetical protein
MIRRPSLRLTPAQAAWPLFLNIHDRCRLGELALEPGVLAAEAGILVRERIGGLRRRAGTLVVQIGRTATQALAPLRQLGGVQAVLAEQGAAPRVAARVGVVFGQDGLAFGGGQGRAVSGWGGLVHAGFLAP